MKGKATRIGVLIAALGVLMALPAAAQAHKFMTEGNTEPVTLTGTNEEHVIITMTNQKLTCEIERLTGTMALSPALGFTLHPEYENCNFAGLEVEVTTEGCYVVLRSETTEDSHAHAKIECDEGKEILIHVLGEACTLKLSETGNETLRGVYYENIGQGTTAEITVETTIEELHYIAQGGLCGLAGIQTGTHADGTLQSTAIITASKNGEHVGLTIE